MHTHIYTIHTLIYIYIYIHARIHTYIHTYIHIYIYIHTYSIPKQYPLNTSTAQPLAPIKPKHPPHSCTCACSQWRPATTWISGWPTPRAGHRSSA